jgi:hypothetical protein
MQPFGGNADYEDLVDAPFLHLARNAPPLTWGQANPISRSSRSTGSRRRIRARVGFSFRAGHEAKR